MNKMYYVDGYHGGIKGHMPVGAWRDVLDALQRNPEWRLCIEIEPISWEYVKLTDPEAYYELKELFKDNSDAAKLEMVSGSYAQPYAWTIGGESNIRQLTRGMEILKEHFPEVLIDTYAVQEPCWTSSMPQLLALLGFKRAVLKNPGTAWGGYTAGYDAEMVNWVGPDGTSIPCVPRYACEELVNCWETEAAFAKSDFAEKCLKNGIKHPAGMFFQDLGWAAQPRVKGKHITYITWRDYIKNIAAAPEKNWRFSQEDILCTLPWGQKTLHVMTKQVRSAENKILQTEKLVSMAKSLTGLKYPEEKLVEAWDQLLLAQHHDAWICATVREGRNKWAWQAGAQTWVTEEICDKIINDVKVALCNEVTPENAGYYDKYIKVVNTLGTRRRAPAVIEISVKPGTRAVLIKDCLGRPVPAQICPTRSYKKDGSINACILTFEADVPGMGFSTYSVQELNYEPAGIYEREAYAEETPHNVIINSDIYRIVLDKARGGVITSLFDKVLNKEFIDAGNERYFNEYRGYFIEEKKWCSSIEHPVEASIVENGPYTVKVELSGRIAENTFKSCIAVTKSQRRIDFKVEFDFEKDTWIGEPWDIAPENSRTERKKSNHDDRWKLQAVFPVSLNKTEIYKNAAYDVCKSRNENTFFSGWDKIKHNVILNWVDMFDKEDNLGIALLSDRTVSYLHGEAYPLGITLGWGWDAGFWWGKTALKGKQESGYSIIPHKGDWEKACISRENADFCEPLVTGVVPGKYKVKTEAYSLLEVTGGEGFEIPAVSFEENDMLVRIFNAKDYKDECVISFGKNPEAAEFVNLKGEGIKKLALTSDTNGFSKISFSMNSFEIKTIKIKFCHL